MRLDVGGSAPTDLPERYFVTGLSERDNTVATKNGNSSVLTPKQQRLLDSTRLIVSFGPSNAGKTVCHTIWNYGAGVLNLGYDVQIGELHRDRTYNGLSQDYQLLAKREWPRATNFDRNTIEVNTYHLEVTVDSSYDLKQQDHPYKVEMVDVGGEASRYSRPNDTAHAALKKQVLDGFAKADGILLFVPVRDAGGTAKCDYKHEVDVLIRTMKKKWRTHVPICVVVSMWDLEVESNGGRLGPKATDTDEQAAENFLEAHHPRLLTELRRHCQHVRVVPVSATGHLNGGKPPSPLQPFNMGTPLIWLLQMSDEIRSDRYGAGLVRRLITATADTWKSIAAAWL